ncbi:MAG: IscS subfamily cysteine desulfurase [Legionellales bacterium]|nr:IscS subfamily cysteine desulfurase [Legionellales bacterium]
MASVYLDYMASTPLAEEALQAMLPCMQAHTPLGNPSSNAYGVKSQVPIALAAQQVASSIGATPDSIIWTSGATEANNLAIKGAAQFYHRQGKHIVTMACEHKAVLGPCQILERLGYEVSYLSPDARGLLDLELLKRTLRKDTVLVSVMHVNNETGIIQDISAISKCVKAVGALLHVDAAQSIGKIPVDVSSMGVDLMTLSAHKAYGPSGVGALYISQKPRLHLVPQMHGGEQQLGLRSGTLPVHQIVGMGAGFASALKDYQQDYERIALLRDHVWHALQSIGGVTLNGHLDHQVPHCLNVSFQGVHMDALLLDLRHFVVSTGSSCNAALNEPSHVLRSMGIDDVSARQSLRISFGKYTQQDECQLFIDQCAASVQRLRQLSPVAL